MQKKSPIKTAHPKLTCLLLLLFLPALADAERLPLKSYTVADGLPNNVINRIVRDSRGFLWFCTDEGLSLFDGYRFTNYGTNEGLPHARVSDILETRAGEYWVATSGGLCKFNPKGLPGGQVDEPGGSQATAPRDPMFTVITPDGDDRYTRNVTTLLEGRDGTIWCGTLRGLFRLDETNGRAALLPVDIGLPTQYPLSGLIDVLLEDRHGTLWIGAASGLYRRWANGSAARYGINDGLTDESIHDLLEDRQGNLWVGTRHGGLLQLTNGVGQEPPKIKRSYNHKNGLTTDWVFGMHESSDGKLWVATNHGLVEFPPDDEKLGGPSRVFTKRNGFSYHEIMNVTEDREGNLWLGTVHGAMKIARNGFLTFGEQDGIYSVNSIFESSTGEMFAYGFVLGDQKASVFDGGRVDVINPGSVLYYFRLGRFEGERFTWLIPTTLKGVDISWSDKPFTIQARTGEWWVGRYLFPRVSSFAQLKTARPIAVYTSTSEPEGVVYSLYEDSRGDVWISTASSTGNGLARWERATRSLRDMSDTEGLPPLKEFLAASFQEDPAGNVWVGFNSGGLARYAAGRFTIFTTDDGLPPGRINDLYLDHAGKLWVATTRGGLGRVDEPTAERPSFINYSIAHGLSSNFTNAITEDQQGRIYVGTGHGLDRITPATGRVKHFTTADGLAPGEIVTALRDRRGTLWFGTTQGVSRFMPEPEEPSLPPPILINGLRLAGEKHTVSPLGETEIVLPELASNKNQLQIDFVGLSFAPGEKLRYQHRLEGADTDWSAPTDQRTVNYASLSPGRYRFLVRAVNSEGVSSPDPASITFTILRPVWMRWWFLTVAAIMVGLGAYALYRYRVRRLLEVANMRTRIATDLHDDIGSGLSRIAILSEVVKQQTGPTVHRSGPLLTEVAESARGLVDSMRDIVWSIDPRRDDLSNVVFRVRQFASDLLEPKKINWDFPALAELERVKLNPEQRRHLFLIFKEAINNIARHAACQSVSLSLTVARNQLTAEICDDGDGFSDALVREAPTNGHAGHGLENMRNRAAQLGGQLTVNSSPGRGTSLKLTLPLKKR